MSYKRLKNMIGAEYLRLQDATGVFGIGPDKLEALARECGALYKVDRCVLIKYTVMKDYIETFKE